MHPQPTEQIALKDEPSCNSVRQEAKSDLTPVDLKQLIQQEMEIARKVPECLQDKDDPIRNPWEVICDPSATEKDWLDAAYALGKRDLNAATKRRHKALSLLLSAGLLLAGATVFAVICFQNSPQLQKQIEHEKARKWGASHYEEISMYRKALLSKLANEWHPKGGPVGPITFDIRLNKNGELVDVRLQNKFGYTQSEIDALKAVLDCREFGQLPEDAPEYLDFRITVSKTPARKA